MQGLFVDSPYGNFIQSNQEMILRFTSEISSKAQQWTDQLIQCPADLEVIERTVQLLGGMLIWAVTLNCAPKKKRFRRDDAPRVGLDITLVQFGFGKGVSPGLQSRVARQVALCPSIAFAHTELTRQGVQLDVKAVKRITYQCGEGLLALRRHRVKLLRARKLKAGKELAGKRVSVQIDGGRMKIRGKMSSKPASTESVDADDLVTGDMPGRSQKRPRQTFSTDWREPKLMTIFVHNEHGKKLKETKATIDGTLLGPNAIAEIVAMHLHRLGAAKAISVTFVADGAPWIMCPNRWHPWVWTV